MNADTLRVVRDPYSDRSADFVVWDDATYGMPFDGTRAQCDRFVAAIKAGHGAGEATHLAHGGQL